MPQADLPIEPPDLGREPSVHADYAIDPNAEFEQAILDGCDLSASRSLALRDVVLRSSRLAGARLDDVACTRVHGIDSSLVGVQCEGAVFRDARFSDCSAKLAVAFASRMTRCLFERCDLREVDLDGSALDHVVFRDCDLRGARLARIDLARVDLRGSRIDGIVVSPERIAGLVVDPTQAEVFARVLGLRVEWADESRDGGDS